MKKIQLKQFFLAVMLLPVLFSCKKDDLQDTVKNPTASEQIIASEQLSIPSNVAVPSNLPGGTIRVATYFADGVQKYKARQQTGNPSAFEWVFVAPDAKLYDISNAYVGTHGAGPFWQVSLADSIFAEQFSPIKMAPAPDGQSIDWLLLKPKTGTTPKGIFADVDYIQRIATKGGKAPQTPPLSITDTVNVGYQAIYRFTKIVP